jgi:hypothetical protein
VHYTSDRLSMDSSTQSLNFPLIAANGNAGRERERPAHNSETKSTKLERLRLARLICHNSKAMNSRHTKGAGEITGLSLLATIINYF